MLTKNREPIWFWYCLDNKYFDIKQFGKLTILLQQRNNLISIFTNNTGRPHNKPKIILGRSLKVGRPHAKPAPNLKSGQYLRYADG